MAVVSVAPIDPLVGRSKSAAWREAILPLGSYERFLAGVLFLIVFVTCGLTPMQTDTWWQLRAGRDMWASGQLLFTDIYSHTAYGTYWVNHEWLAEVVFYLLYQIGGLRLLTLFCAMLITGGWMFSWAMRRGPARLSFVLFVLALVSSSGWWEPRPHAFSLLFIPWMVFLLQRGTPKALPLIFLVWANCHGGVLLGLVLLVGGLFARSFVDRTEWRRSVAIIAACLVAMTITPLGWHFWTEIPRSLGRISQYTLDEWTRPGLSEIPLIPFWVFAIGYGVGIARQLPHIRHIRASEAALNAVALLLLPGALTAVRNVGPFLMVAVPALTGMWSRPSDILIETSAKERRGFNLGLLGAAAAIIVIVLSVAYDEPWERLKWKPVPERAIAALGECPGNLYNRYDEGGYLLWFAPERRVFLDGRQDPFPLQMVLEHIEMETGGRDYRETFVRHDIGCAFLPVASPVAVSLARDQWTSLYRDSQWTVLRRN